MPGRWDIDLQEDVQGLEAKLLVEARSGRPLMPNGEVCTLLPDTGVLLKIFQQRTSYLHQHLVQSDFRLAWLHPGPSLSLSPSLGSASSVLTPLPGLMLQGGCSSASASTFSLIFLQL